MPEIFEDGGMFEYREAWSRRNDSVEEEIEVFGDLEFVSHPDFDTSRGTVIRVYLNERVVGKVSLNFDCTIEAECSPAHQPTIAEAICQISNRFMF